MDRVEALARILDDPDPAVRRARLGELFRRIETAALARLPADKHDEVRAIIRAQRGDCLFALWLRDVVSHAKSGDGPPA